MKLNTFLTSKSAVRFTKMIISIFLLSSFTAAQIPYVYTVENTGASYPLPPMPTLANAPTITYLPDPFAWQDGSGRSTAFSDWSHHRNDFRAQFENYEIGTKPTVTSSQVTASYSGNTLTINITANGQSMTMTCAVSIPAGATAPYPVCIGMNSSYGSVPSSLFTSRGIVGITFSHNQVTTYNNPQNTDPFFRLYPTQNVDNTGQYAAWAWGVSRIIDALYKVQGSLNVDLNRIAVTGCSYAGKMALFSGAFDERVALTIAQESGGGGATSWRYSKTEPDGTVEGLAQTSHQWFKEDMFQFGGNNVTKLPEDHHMLMAMCAPRALLVTANTDYTWLSNPSCYVASRAVQQIYSTLGISDRFGFIVDSGHSHCAVPTSQNAAIGYFLDKFIKGNTSLSQIIQTFPSSYSTINYAVWYSEWGSSGPSLSVSPSTVSVAAAANSTGTFNITSNTSWTVSDNQTWLTVSASSGSNNATVTVTAQENTGTSSRSATVTVSATGVPSQTVTVTQAGTGGGSTSVWLEAECGSLGSLWTTPTDASASEGRYLTIQAGNNSTANAPTNSAGYANFSFNVSQSGTYQVFARVLCPTGNDDSWWVRMDGGTWVNWNNIAATSWSWVQFPNTFSLSAGSHTLTFAYREDGAQLDKLNITTSTTAPTGTGSAAENLCSATSLSVSPTSVNVAAAANSTGTFNITSNTSWTVASNQSWLSVSPTSGSNNATVMVTAQQNTGASRQATVTVSATGVSPQTVTVTQAAGSSGSTSVWLEAECASVGSLWNIPTDATASNSRYVTIQSGNNSTASAPTNSAGYINFSFSVSASGTYRVFARVKHPTANDDSWWVRMDGGTWVNWNNFAATSWTWGQFPNTFSLSAGSHTLTFAYREDGAQLDKVNITTSTTAPTGTGSAAENLCTPKIGEEQINQAEPPSEYLLVQNYPNPFNPTTQISFALPENSFVSLKVYNSLGEEIAELAGREYSAGTHSVTFDATGLASGVYFYAIRAGKFSTSQKMLLQK